MVICFTAPSRPEETVRPDRPDAVSFRPSSAGGTRVGGELLLAHDGAPARPIKVWMTWDALDRLRTELSRYGINVGDAAILRRVLTFWGVEEYTRLGRAGERLPHDGLLLTITGGPASHEPRRLLVSCGLLPMRSV